ncbi:MAG TPA: hypothetical protein VFE38_01535 [Edaphobacter sp.]|nr:hypothetical protein [Edaphobacter sp.]
MDFSKIKEEAHRKLKSNRSNASNRSSAMGLSDMNKTAAWSINAGTLAGLLGDDLRQVLRHTESATAKQGREVGIAMPHVANSAISMQRQVESTLKGASDIYKQFSTAAQALQNIQSSFVMAATKLVDPYLRLLAGVKRTSDEIERFADPYKKIGEAIRATSPESLKEIQKVFLTFSTSYQMQWGETERKAFKIFEKAGLVGLERYLTRSELLSVVRIHKKKGVKGVQSYIFNKFRRQQFKLLKRVVRGWWKLPYMAKRKKIVRLAIKAHQLRHYDLCIPTLLPLIDGVAAEFADEFLPPATNKKQSVIRMREVAKHFNEQEGEVSSACVEQVVWAMVYKNYDFRTAKRPPSSVNRHAILHGRVISYGTEINSYRVLLLLDIVIRMTAKQRVAQI